MQILLTNAKKYSKGILSEILDFVMGTGLIPADGEVWKMRRRCAGLRCIARQPNDPFKPFLKMALELLLSHVNPAMNFILFIYRPAVYICER
jgi:hypothetical protein